MEKNMLKSFFSFSIGGYLSLAIGFFTTPIVTRLISPEEYGVFSIFNLFLNIFLLISLIGLDQGFIRFYYEEKDKSQLLQKCILFSFGVYIFEVFVIYIFRNKISIYLFGNYNKEIIFIVMAYIPILIINTFANIIIRMERKGFTYSTLQALLPLFNFVFILFFYNKIGNSFKTLLYSLVISNFFIMIISIICEKEKWFYIFKMSDEKSNISLTELLKYSYPILITVLLSWLFQSMDKIFIKKYSTLFELGLYAAGFKIISLFRVISDGFSLFWTPLSFEKYNKDPDNTIFFKNMFNYISILFLIFAICVLMSKNLIILILGKNYREASKIIAPLIFIPLMETLSNITGSGIYLKKKSWYHLIVSLVVSGTNILGNYVLVPKLGAKGAAISTCISYILYFIIRMYLSEKLIKFDFEKKKFYISVILLFLYTLITMFYNKLILELLLGIFLIILISFVYLKEIKKLYKEGKKYLKNIKMN